MGSGVSMLLCIVRQVSKRMHSLHFRHVSKVTSVSHNTHSILLISICLVAFYLVYGWGPFTHFQEKVKHDTEVEIEQKESSHEDMREISWAEGGPEHCFWPKDESCSKFVTKFAKVGSIPTHALVSYPGSGNTWIRYLIEGATGVYTGSIFNDKSILRAGHAGEGRAYTDGSTILQKTHHRSLYVESYKKHGLPWRKTHIKSFGGRGVVVVRNPYKAILSYWNFYNTKSHTKVIDDNSFDSLKFKDFVFTGASRWFEVIEDWIHFGKSLHFIFYEDLSEDPVGEMRRLLNYLGLPVQEERLNCITSHLTGNFRRVKHQSTEDPFTEDHHMMIRTVIAKAKTLISENRGGSLPVDKYEFYNKPLNEAEIKVNN